LYGATKSQKTQQGPYSPTNQKTLSVDIPVDVMDVDTEGVKRVADDTNDEMMKRVDQGEFIPDFLNMLNKANQPTIQQQMIMQVYHLINNIRKVI